MVPDLWLPYIEHSAIVPIFSIKRLKIIPFSRFVFKHFSTMRQCLFETPSGRCDEVKKVEQLHTDDRRSSFPLRVDILADGDMP